MSTNSIFSQLPLAEFLRKSLYNRGMDDPGATRSPPDIPKYTLGAAAVVGYALLMFLSGRLGWQHLSLVLLIWFCNARQPGLRRFMRDWWPMVLFWLSYDLMRIFAHQLLARAAVEAPLQWEFRLFRSPDGTIWPFYFARWTAVHSSGSWHKMLQGFFSIVYISHIFAVPVLMFVVWLRREDLLFRRLLWSLTALHAITLCIYLGYPAAPPWWVYENGFVLPSAAHSMPQQTSTLSGLFHLSPNRFAAIPSLHAAYPLLLTLVLALQGIGTRWVLVAGAYAAGMWFACVFLNQHYIVDLLIGAVLVPLALTAVVRVRSRA